LQIHFQQNSLGFYQLEMISKEVIPTETLKWEKDALDFSILGKNISIWLHYTN